MLIHKGRQVSTLQIFCNPLHEIKFKLHSSMFINQWIRFGLFTSKSKRTEFNFIRGFQQLHVVTRCAKAGEPAYFNISTSCHPPTNHMQGTNARSNFKNGGDNFIVYYFVTGRYFEFLSVLLSIFFGYLRVFLCGQVGF